MGIILIFMIFQSVCGLPISSSNERFIQDAVRSMKEDLKFYEELERQPLLLEVPTTPKDHMESLMSIYTVESRLNEIQKREIQRIEQHQSIQKELFDYLNTFQEDIYHRSDLESIREKYLEDIKCNEEMLRMLSDIYRSVIEHIGVKRDRINGR